MLTYRKIVDLLVLLAVICLQNSSCADFIVPKIIEHPKDVIVAKNSNAELLCRAIGKPKPKIHWLRDGKRLPTDDDDPDGRRFIMPSGNLTFLRVIQKKRKTDDGKYQCVAVNEAGTVKSNPAILTVGVLRSHFKTEPKDRTVTVGNSVTLKCNPPRGKPPPVVSWLKDGLMLQPDSGRVSIVEPGSLYISNAQKVDQGEYVCQAMNVLGQKRSKPARLTVKELPSTALSVRPKNKVVTVGSDVVFKCEYRDGPQGAIRWYKKGGILPVNRYETTQYGELKIKNTKPEDGGEYVCSISNSLRDTAKLVVQTKPFISAKPVDVVIREGTNAMFQCQATGNPLPTVFWERKSTRKPMFPHQDNGRFVVKTTGELLIKKVKPEDQDEYVCLALSNAGVSTSSARLTVVGKSSTKPSLTRGPTNQTLQESEEAIFRCVFSGIPTPTIQWYKNPVSFISNSSKYEVTKSGYKTQLKIESIKKADEGEYVCTASNVLGSVQGRAHLLIKGSATTGPPPLVVTIPTTPISTPAVPTSKQLSAPSDLLHASITSNSVLLVWTSVKSAKLPITYTVEYKKADKLSRKWKTATDSITANSFFVMGLEPDMFYEFSVRAKTAQSQSKRATAIYKTFPLKTTHKPVVSTKKHSHVKVLVRVEPLEWDKLNITWKFNRHTKRRPSGFHVFWKEEDSPDLFNKVVVMGDGLQQHTLTRLSANTSYVVQVQVFFNKHKLSKTKPVTAITGTQDSGLVVIIDGGEGTKRGTADSDVKIIQADTRNGGTWARVREFVRKPWFIAIMGGVLWIILSVVVFLLYRRRRRNRRNLKQRKLKLQIAEIQRAPVSPQGHKTLWMDDVTTADTPPQQPANNRMSDTSSTECLNRSVTSCCARRGINSTVATDFPNKITLNSLTDRDPAQLDVSTDSRLSEGKTNNLHQQHTINNYRDQLNKSAKFEEGVELASIGSRSGSEATLPRAMPQQTSFLTPTQQFINRKKANSRSDSPASQPKDPNQTPDDASVTDKTKPKLKIQSYDVASNGSIPSTTTFHADPPPTYEAVLKETELQKQMSDDKEEEMSKSKEELAEKFKAPPFSEKPAQRPPSPPLSERSCKTTSSCGSRKRKVLKPPPRLAILNWADLLPPPPSHPPPSSLGSPPPSPPFSLRSGMSGMSGLTGMSGMTGLTGMTGMTGMTGRTGKSSANGLGDSDVPERIRKRPGPSSSAVSDSVASAEPKVPGSTKSKSSKHKKPKAKAMPIDLEGITSDIIMQWADSVTNTSGSDDDSSCSSPSRVSSTGSFFTDADFANAVRAAAECGGFNMETYGLMDSLGYPPPYSGSWKQSNPASNASDPSGATVNPRPPLNNKNKWETGSEGDPEYTPPITVRPRFTRKPQTPDNGAPPPVGPSKMATDMGIRKVARSPVPIVPSQPRRPVPRAARNLSNSPVPATGQIIVQPLKKTSALSNTDVANRSPVTKKFAVVKKIPQSKDVEYNSATLSSSGKSSTSTASTVKTSTMGDSDEDSAA